MLYQSERQSRSNVLYLFLLKEKALKELLSNNHYRCHVQSEKELSFAKVSVAGKSEGFAG